MSSVLIIDAHPIFRDFIKEKLSLEKVEVIIASEDRDAFPKTLSALPNLIIMDKGESQVTETEFLRKKANDPNASSIPMIVTGPVIDKSKLGALARYGVIKYFTKPVKFDLLFESIGKILRIPIIMDTTPCVMDVHRNGNIIFIEVAQGLNREKLALLKFRLAEMIEQEELETPKVVLMLTSLELSFIDGLNLEFLLDNVLDNPKIHERNVKILSLSPFVRALVSGHSEYRGIEVSDNLSEILTSIVDSVDSTNISDMISDFVLSKSNTDELESTVETRFYSDIKDVLAEDSETVLTNNTVGAVFSVAIIDNSQESTTVTKKAFEKIGGKAEVFNTGRQFLDNYAPGKYNLLILDVLSPNSMGIEIIKNFKKTPDSPPVIVYTASAQRNLIVKFLECGAAYYLTKPQSVSLLLSKAIQILNQKK